MKHIFFLLALFASTLHAQKIDLSGVWHVSFSDREADVKLPGSMLTNNLGDEVTVRTRWTGSLYDSSFYFNPYMEPYRKDGSVKFPFFLTPSKHFVGEAVYTRKVVVPRSWLDRRVLLRLERPHIETTVYVNGKLAGRDSSLSVPHLFDITPLVRFGRENTLQVRVYNGIENVCVGQDSHSVTDQTQGNWNGLAGDISLQSRPLDYITSLQVYPRVREKRVEVRLALSGRMKGKRVSFFIDGSPVSGPVDFSDSALVAVLPVGEEVELWDEFTPRLYSLTAVVGRDTLSSSFGMREIKVEGSSIKVNGRTVRLRGTVENCCFPDTGYPPTDEESWLRIFRKCKEYGLNHVRFHSYSPPEAAFSAADRVGVYLQPEGPSWPNHGVKLRRGMPIDRYLMEETRRMVQAYGNHPSFCMLAAGNEPAGDWVAWCRDFVDSWHRSGDDRRIYCGASVGGGWAWDGRSDYHVKGGARGLEWDRRAPQSEDNYDAQLLRPRHFTPRDMSPHALRPDTLPSGEVELVNNSPVVAHEQGQWCAFPDLKEVAQYQGAYKAGNFTIFADLLSAHGMASQAEKFLEASGRLQTLAYKYEIERNLRTAGYAGFQLLGLNDYSGQGTALVGVLNVFWREKGYCTAADWTSFCAPVVPLALFPKFVFTDGDTLTLPLQVNNSYREPLRSSRVVWTLKDRSSGRVVDSACYDFGTVPMGLSSLRPLSLPMLLRDGAEVSALSLTVSVVSPGVPEATNRWDLWVYPRPSSVAVPEDIHVTDTLDSYALAVLSAGGKVLIEAAGKIRYGSDVCQTYLPVFWNTSWFKMRPPHTTGCLIDSAHPLFTHFPTDTWGNLNWWELLHRAQVINLDRFPAGYQSPVQPIDTWHISRKLGMLVEARVGGGSLLLTTMDISSRLDVRPVACQMRRALLRYMSSADFSPSLSLSPSDITALFELTAPPVNMFTKDSPDELKPRIVAGQ